MDSACRHVNLGRCAHETNLQVFLFLLSNNDIPKVSNVLIFSQCLLQPRRFPESVRKDGIVDLEAIIHSNGLPALGLSGSRLQWQGFKKRHVVSAERLGEERGDCGNF